MTTTLPPRIIPKPAPILPRVVHVTRRHDNLTAHATTDCRHAHGATRADTHAIRGAEPAWCDQSACWPGRRCIFCQAPSGDRGECATCAPTSTAVEKRRDAVDGWDAA